MSKLGYVAVTIVFCVCTAHAQTSLIANGDFSDGTNHWSTKAGFTISNTVGNPAPAARLSVGDGGFLSVSSDCIDRNIDNYALHVDAKTDTQGANAAFIITGYNGANCTGTSASAGGYGDNLATGAWVTFGFDPYDLSAYSSFRVSLQVNRSGKSAATIYFDNVVLTALPNTPVTLQSFEVN